MLKHEEMIENVHRRIAEYEEEKKMKHSAFKNIISAIKPNSKNKKVNEEYTESVSGTETFSSSNRMMRTVGSLAAAAVLVTGIGATSFMLYKNKSNRSALPVEDVVLTENTNTTDTVDIADPGAVAPFADFKQISFGLWILNNYDFVEYSNATYDKLAIFLNNFNWGEENEIAESDIPDFDNYEGNGYEINWRKGDVYFYVDITAEGKAYYTEKKCTPDGNCYNYPIIKSAVFDIDYEAFDKSIQDIWSSNVPDTDKYISKREKMYLTQGEFQNGMVEREGHDSGNVISESNKSFNALQGFLKEDFVGMLQKDKPIDFDSNDLIYNVVCYYKSSDTTTRRLTYYISSNGVANLCEYELTESADIPTGYANYYIDIEEFENVLDDILSGKYDDKYSFEVKTTTTAVSTSTTSTETTTVTTNEQVKAPEEEPEEEPVEKEPTEEDIFREYYYAGVDGWEDADRSWNALDENGNMVYYKDIVSFMFHRADVYFPSDRLLGPIIDEEDAIAKGREMLIRLSGQEYVDSHDKKYVVRYDGTKIIRDNPCYIADYNEEYDIWDFRPTLFSGTSEDGSYHIATPGSVPHFYFRGSDGKILACYH